MFQVKEKNFRTVHSRKFSISQIPHTFDNFESDNFLKASKCKKSDCKNNKFFATKKTSLIFVNAHSTLE